MLAASLIERMLRTGKHKIEVDRGVFQKFNAKVQERLSKTVWATTKNYFQAGTGKVVSQWPFSPSAYVLSTKLARRKAIKIK